MNEGSKHVMLLQECLIIVLVAFLLLLPEIGDININCRCHRNNPILRTSSRSSNLGLIWKNYLAIIFVDQFTKISPKNDFPLAGHRVTD